MRATVVLLCLVGGISLAVACVDTSGLFDGISDGGSDALSGDSATPVDSSVDSRVPPGPDAKDDARSDAADSATDSADSADAQGDSADARNDSEKPPLTCVADPTYVSPLAVPEVSAAAVVELNGTRFLYVLGDSGNNGRGLLEDLATGARSRLDLPLDTAASDDIEGMTQHAGILYTITSSGAVREFVPGGSAFTQSIPAYPIAPPPFSCPNLLDVNCGKNLEGICLSAVRSAEGCDGYLASKAEGRLYCVVMTAQGRLSINAGVPPITLALPATALSDCAFGSEGSAYGQVLVIATNGADGNMSYRVDPATGALTPLFAAGTTSTEAIALDPAGRLYLVTDTATTPSPGARFVCTGW